MIPALWMMFMGCSTSGPPPSGKWSADKVTAAVFSRLDDNGDGELQPAEFPAPGPGFGSIDTDQSGTLDAKEILAGIQGMDPLTFDDRPGRPPVSVTRWRSALKRSPQARERWEHLRFLVIEVQARRPATPVPDAATTSTLSQAGGPAYIATLKRLTLALDQPPSGARQ